MAADIRKRLTDLRNGLLSLHLTLLESQRDHYERDIQRITSRGRLLELLFQDPSFTWLRELSQLIVVIDERLDASDPPGAHESERLIARARALISPGETSATFEKPYLEALQRDPDVVMAHSATLKLLRDLQSAP